MKNVLPPVIEELLRVCKQTTGANLHSGKFHKAIVAVQQYKKELEKENLISLFCETEGGDRIEIRMPRNLISYEESFLRKDLKEYFAEMCELVINGPLKKVYFEDEI